MVQHRAIVRNPITTTVIFRTLVEARTAKQWVNCWAAVLANQSTGLFELTLTKTEFERYWDAYIAQEELSDAA